MVNRWCRGGPEVVHRCFRGAEVQVQVQVQMCRVRRWRDAEALSSTRCRGAEFLSRCRGFVEVIVHSKVIVQMQILQRY